MRIERRTPLKPVTLRRLIQIDDIGIRNPVARCIRSKTSSAPILSQVASDVLAQKYSARRGVAPA